MTDSLCIFLSDGGLHTGRGLVASPARQNNIHTCNNKKLHFRVLELAL